LNLVSARPRQLVQKPTVDTTGTEANDPDLKRAKDLLELHATVKVAHQDGTAKELNDARDAVARVLREL